MANHKSRVLIIEDHEDSAACLAILLRGAGYRVEVSHDGSEALAAVKDHRFDVALCDIGLPDIDGCELFSRLSAIQPVKGIALTGFSITEDYDRFLAAGFMTRLLKPFDFEEVLAAIREVVPETSDAGKEMH